MIQDFEYAFNKIIWGESTYINFFGLSSKLLNKFYIPEANTSIELIKDNNEQLHLLKESINSEPYIKEVIRVKNVLDKMNIPLLYIQTPIKVIEDYTEIPVGLNDYSKENADVTLKKLEIAGIETLDLRKNIKNSNINYNTLFFNTDHHWTIQTAFWGMEQVVQNLKECFKIDLDPKYFYTNVSNYEQKIYKDSFLGSQGRRVGKYYGGVDDFTLIIPSFETDYTVIVQKPDKKINKERGSFEEVIINKNILKGNNLFTNRYLAYHGGDYSEYIMKNHKANNNMKILIFKDSFGRPFSSFLSTMVSETRLLDTRYFKGDVLEYIKEYKPNLVLYLYSTIDEMWKS